MADAAPQIAAILLECPTDGLTPVEAHRALDRAVAKACPNASRDERARGRAIAMHLLSLEALEVAADIEALARSEARGPHDS